MSIVTLISVAPAVLDLLPALAKAREYIAKKYAARTPDAVDESEARLDEQLAKIAGDAYTILTKVEPALASVTTAARLASYFDMAEDFVYQAITTGRPLVNAIKDDVAKAKLVGPPAPAA